MIQINENYSNLYAATTEPPRIHTLLSFNRRFALDATSNVLDWPISEPSARIYNILDDEELVVDTVLLAKYAQRAERDLQCTRVIAIGSAGNADMAIPYSESYYWPRAGAPRLTLEVPHNFTPPKYQELKCLEPLKSSMVPWEEFNF